MTNVFSLLEFIIASYPNLKGVWLGLLDIDGKEIKVAGYKRQFYSLFDMASKTLGINLGFPIDDNANTPYVYFFGLYTDQTEDEWFLKFSFYDPVSAMSPHQIHTSGFRFNLHPIKITFLDY